MAKAVFLDRDNTIIFDREGYVHEIEKFELIPKVVNGLKILQDLDYKLIFITNQSGINRGYFSLSDYKKFNNYVVDSLKKQGIKINATYYCPHKPNENCGCRKPKPYLINKAASEFNIDLKLSWMVGDKTADIKIGKLAGCKTILVKTGKKEERRITDLDVPPDYVTENLEQAANIIKNES